MHNVRTNCATATVLPGPRDRVVVFTKYERREHAGHRLERVDSRVDTQLIDPTRKHSRCVEMRERHRQDRGIRSLVGGGKALLPAAQTGCERRLVPGSGWDTTGQVSY